MVNHGKRQTPKFTFRKFIDFRIALRALVNSLHVYSLYRNMRRNHLYGNHPQHHRFRLLKVDTRK